MKKGVVLEINETVVTLLTPDGEFLRARKLNIPYALGEEISFFPMTEEKRAKFSFSIKKAFIFKMTAAVSAVTILAMSSLNPFSKQSQVYAYMSIDVNPSIELGVNKDMEVIELKGFNKEGKEIVNELRDWKNRDAVKVTETLLDEIKEDGYFENSHEILITTVATDGKDKKAANVMKKEVSKIAEAVNEEQLKLTVVEATKQDRKKAHQLGLTVGKYKRIQKKEEKVNTPGDATQKSSIPKVNTPNIEKSDKKKTPDLNIKKNERKKTKQKKQNGIDTTLPPKAKNSQNKIVVPKKVNVAKPIKMQNKNSLTKKPLKVEKKIENNHKKMIKKRESQGSKNNNKNHNKEKNEKSGH